MCGQKTIISDPRVNPFRIRSTISDWMWTGEWTEYTCSDYIICLQKDRWVIKLGIFRAWAHLLATPKQGTSDPERCSVPLYTYTSAILAREYCLFYWQIFRVYAFLNDVFFTQTTQIIICVIIRKLYNMIFFWMRWCLCNVHCICTTIPGIPVGY